MRELKFRAWNNSRKQMYFVGDEFGTAHPFDALIYQMQGQNVILMQYTGLKDKNGVEIYEGDIVQSKDYLPSIVGYDESRCCFMFHDLVVAEGECYKAHEEWEIIGSIFENPELLGA